MTINVYEEYDFNDVYNYCYDSQTEDLLDDISNAQKEDEFMDLLANDNLEGYISKTAMYDFVRFEDDFIRERLDLHPDEDEEEEDEDE